MSKKKKEKEERPIEQVKKNWHGSESLVGMLVDIESIELDKRNARGHSDKDISATSDSLDKFGQMKPIVVRNGIVIAGNGTLQAAKKLGWEKIAVSNADSLTETQARAYALMDNRTAELSFWDMNVLPYEIEKLSQLDFPIFELGWSKNEMEGFDKIVNNSDVDVSPQLKHLSYRVIVENLDEETQIKLVSKLISEGYKVKAMLS